VNYYRAIVFHFLVHIGRCGQAFLDGRKIVKLDANLRDANRGDVNDDQRVNHAFIALTFFLISPTPDGCSRRSPNNERLSLKQLHDRVAGKET
jgi:hypothetical protein